LTKYWAGPSVPGRWTSPGFGNGAYGIEEASQAYFHHGAASLSLAQAALLAGIPADPSLYDPVANPRAAQARRRVVLRAMLQQGDITRALFRAANTKPLPRHVRLPGTEGPAQYFVNYVKQQLIDKYGTRKVYGGGLKVVTSIDLRMQQLAREAVTKWLGSKNGPAAALVAVDPRDGRVLAMYGGRNFRESQFNLAVQGERQPGSSFKPIVLAAALSRGISPETQFESKPLAIPYDNKVWAVHNYEGSNLGWIDLSTATTYSDNTYYAQLTRVVQPVNVVRTAKALGITSPLQSYFSIGLGGEAVNPLEMARAYATFANDGTRVDTKLFGNHPRAILSVSGEKNAPEEHEALTPNQAAIIDSLLQDVVTSGTGRRAQLSDRPVAGKTGTTENYGDAWFVGYTPQLAVAVWVGYPDRLKPMLTDFNGDAVAGGTYPALIFKAFMERALPYLKAEPESFPIPSYEPTQTERVVLRDGVWERDNGLCRNTIPIVYVSSAADDVKAANCKPNEVEVPNVIGELEADAEARLQAQPLTPVVIYKPASPGQRLDLVVGQFPKRGRLSSYDKVTLVLAKAVHGIVPSVVGLPLDLARRKLERMHLIPAVTLRTPSSLDGLKVISQVPRGGVAAGPGLAISLVVGR
jgi:penicillin-binding protein 1A